MLAEHFQHAELIEHRSAAVQVERRAERGLDLGKLVVHRDVLEAVMVKRERGGQAARARAHDGDAQRRGSLFRSGPERVVPGVVRGGTRRRDGRPGTARRRANAVGTSSRSEGSDRTSRRPRVEPGARRVPGGEAASGRGARRRHEIRRGGHHARRSGVWRGGERRASERGYRWRR